MRHFRQTLSCVFRRSRNESLDAIIQPIGWKIDFIGDLLSPPPDDLRRLEDGIHVVRGQSGIERQHHGCSAKEAYFSDDALLPELIIQNRERLENRLLGESRTVIGSVHLCSPTLQDRPCRRKSCLRLPRDYPSPPKKSAKICVNLRKNSPSEDFWRPLLRKKRSSLQRYLKSGPGCASFPVLEKP